MASLDYIPRHLTSLFFSYLEQFPVVLLLGARQVGKSTFLSRVLSDWERVDLENPGLAERLTSDVELFLQDHPEKVWFDEAQRVPELFSALRWKIDQDRRPGQFVLSGSANPALVREVSESLAGRIGILELGPLSVAEQVRGPMPEVIGRALHYVSPSAFLRSIEAGIAGPERSADYRELWLRGGYPEPACKLSSLQGWRWFESYVRTLSERDLQTVAPGLRPPQLARLLRMLAARHGQTVHYSQLGADFGASHRTLRHFLDALEAAFLWRRLSPWYRNLGKRLVKAPKGYLTDSGLLHFLLGIMDKRALEEHPVLGFSWEGWMMDQLLGQIALLEPKPRVYFWRTHAGAEVDLIIESGRRLVPIEIKHAAQIRPMEFRGLRQFLTDFSDQAPFGILIYRGEILARAEKNILLLPASKIVFG